MDDSKIVQLYLDRSQEAVKITQEQYGKYCYSIALSVLKNPEDALLQTRGLLLIRSKKHPQSHEGLSQKLPLSHQTCF